MRKKHFLIISVILAVFGLAVFGGFSSENFISPIETNAQTASNPFAEINDLAKQNKLNPTYKRSKNITNKVIDLVSVLEIPSITKDDIAGQVATAQMNGTSSINENNIVVAINNLAQQSSAPSYAYTDVEQVKVCRKILNRVMPDLVSSTGNMHDIEAIGVFTCTLSQKFDNEAFMVSNSEFITMLGSPSNQPLPGTSAATVETIQVAEKSAKITEMENVLDTYTSQNSLSSTNIISSIGIE